MQTVTNVGAWITCETVIVIDAVVIGIVTVIGRESGIVTETAETVIVTMEVVMVAEIVVAMEGLHTSEGHLVLLFVLVVIKLSKVFIKREMSCILSSIISSYQ